MHYLFTIFLLILFIPQVYSHEWDKGIKLFSLKMTIHEIERILIRYKNNYKKPNFYQNHYSYFLEGKYIKNQMLYYNDSDLQITKNTDSQGQFIEGKLILKKTFGLKLGLIEGLENFNVFNSLDPHIDSHKNFQVQKFNSRFIYHYLFFPVKRINPFIHSINLAFFKQKLFKIIYEVYFSDQQSKYFLQQTSSPANQQNPLTFNTIFKKNPKNQHSLIEYQDKKLYAQYIKYLERIKVKMNQSIKNYHFHQIDQFIFNSQ